MAVLRDWRAFVHLAVPGVIMVCTVVPIGARALVTCTATAVVHARDPARGHVRLEVVTHRLQPLP